MLDRLILLDRCDAPFKNASWRGESASSPEMALPVAFLAIHVVVVAMAARLLAGAFAVALILLAGPILVPLVLLLIAVALALTLVGAFLRIFDIGIGVGHIVSSAVVELSHRVVRRSVTQM
jgi:hypothetical protein